MPMLNIILQGDGCWPDLESKGDGAIISVDSFAVALMPGGMASGKASVSIRHRFARRADHHRANQPGAIRRRGARVSGAARGAGGARGQGRAAVMMSARENAPQWARIDGTTGALEMFTVLAYPIDYPRHWVVRRTFVLHTGDLILDVVPHLAVDLEGAREHIPPGLYCQPRGAGDEPHIMEIWF